MSQAAAIFDLDGTLFEHNVWRALIRHHRQRPTLGRRWHVWRYLATHLPTLIPYGMGLMSRQTLYRLWGGHMAWLVRGADAAELSEIWSWLWEREIQPHLRPQLVERLERHRRQGHRLVLISGTFQEFLEAIGQRLGMHDSLGTEIEWRQGRLTGGLRSAFLQGGAKLQVLRRRWLEIGTQVDLSQSWAYGDSILDAPLLEAVGHPVAVAPDPQLRAHALARGWPVLEGGAAPLTERG